MSSPRRVELYKPDRLLAFSDGVFGVAITLLVIDVHLPPVPEGGDDAVLLKALRGMAPNLFVFAFTFIVLGMSWLGHHRKFSYIERVDGRLLWMNLLYLMALCLVPFASSVLAAHGPNRFAFALYAGVMALTLMCSAASSAYGLRPPFLKERMDFQPGFRKDMLMSPLVTGVIFLAGGLIALCGLVRLAHWTLILIVPAMIFFGSRTR